jgi:SAM-dependent methyltransferase
VNARLRLRTHDGILLSLPRERWLGPATAEEEEVLDRALPPVLDVGCGPGRHVLALAERGIVSLGVDASPTAVRMASERGASVIHRSIFEPVPGTGRWGTALLLDGNIGIGGDAEALLLRVGELLRPNGRVLLEAEPPGTATGRIFLRVENGSMVGPLFPWARMGADRLEEFAARTGFRIAELWSSNLRWFAALERR